MKNFKAKIYRINKGKGQVESYIATIRQAAFKSLKLLSSTEILIKDKENNIFPTKIVKQGKSYSFTIPRQIGKKYKIKTQYEFKIYKQGIDSSHEVRDRYINILNIIPTKTIRGFSIYKFDLDEQVLFWIYTKGCKPFSLPKFIPLNSEEFSLLELCGAFLCEGLKARRGNKHRERLSFSNAEISEIDWFIKCAEALLGVDRKIWKAQILFPNKDARTVQTLKSYWSQAGLDTQKISVVKNRKIGAKQGVCILNIQSAVLAEVFDYIFQHCKSLATSSPQYALQFFRGLSRGDISVIIRRESLIGINFSTESSENISIFIDVCKQFGVTTSKSYFTARKKGYWQINITGYGNMLKLARLNAITHRRRRVSFLKGLLKNKRSNIYKYLKAVDTGANTSSKAVEPLSLSIITTRALLAKYRREGYLKIKSIEPLHKAICNTLTKEGEDLLSFYSTIEKEIRISNYDTATDNYRAWTLDS